MLGEFDADVIDYVKSLRNSGAIVNRQIVMAGARGIIKNKASHLLVENGGHVNIERSWAESFLRRVGYVRRKGTKAARKLPFDFEEQKITFLSDVRDIISEHSIPEQLVLNFDQTNIMIIPCGNWTLEEQGL